MMTTHMKRKLLQFLMNRFFLGLRKIPDQRMEPTQPSLDQVTFGMHLDEKIDYVSGVESFCVRPIKRMEIPAMWMSDATSGIRGVDAPVTIFPSAIAMAATWNPDLIETLGRVLGDECRATGISILLGPGVNIARVPINGRNFEYMGEDPHLAGSIASSYVRGVQSKGVATTVKHFACNNSEYDRHKCDSVVSEKVLRELYLPAFEAVVAAGTEGVMSAYNPINGSYASEHSHLIEDILRNEWGFSGMVVSDWNSLYSTEGPLLHGVDIEMPKGKWFSHTRLKQTIEAHPHWEPYLDRKIDHIRGVSERMGIADRPLIDDNSPCGTAAHKSIAASVASESIVLLKNEHNLLPLNRNEITHVVIIGSLVAGEPIGGGGSSFIKQGEPGAPIHAEIKARYPEVRINVYRGKWWRSEKKRNLLAKADVVIATVGFNHIHESESYDRQWRMDKIDRWHLDHACSLNEHTMVVFHGGGAVEMSSWVDTPQAILFCWYLGETSAKAITDVLFGETDPTGRLPISLARKLEDWEAMEHYPKDFEEIRLSRIQGGQGNPHKRNTWQLHYLEGLMVGYRQFATVGPEPLFPFGFGLTYAEFAYDDLSLQQVHEKWKVTCTITNTSQRSGTEVAQLYIRPPVVDRNHPAIQLKGFCKIHLNPKESSIVEFHLSARAFSEWDGKKSAWAVVPGMHTIIIGTSAMDHRLSMDVEIKDSPDHGRNDPGTITI